MPEDLAQLNHDAFFHVRVIVGMVTGLSITRLLAGLARFVQHPGKQKIYPLHFGWAIFLILAVVHFWWFEFALARVEAWNFGIYLFVIAYATSFYFACVLLFPDDMAEYSGYQDYFQSRRRWFYALLALIFFIDIGDTAIKGWSYFEAQGDFYLWRQILLAGLALSAVWISSARLQMLVLLVALAAQVWWILDQFNVTG